MKSILICCLFLAGCDDEGKCQERVKYLSAASSADTSGLVCDSGSKLNLEQKDNAMVATCRCPPPTASSAKPANTE